MKKIICALVAAVLAAALCSCSSSGSSDTQSESSVSTTTKTNSDSSSVSEKPDDTSTAAGESSAAEPAPDSSEQTQSTITTTASQVKTSDDEKQTGKSDGSNSQADTQSADYKITDQFFHTYKYGNENRYYAIIEVVNTSGKNLQLYKCIFNFFDNNGKQLGTEASGDDWAPADIAPGETGYLYAYSPSARIPGKVPLDNGIKLVPEITVKESKNKIYDMPVSDVKMTRNDDGSVSVSGKVGNTRKSSTSIVVKVLFKDENDKVIAIESDYVTKIEPNTSKSFEATTYKKSDPEINKRIKSYTVIARW